MVDPLTDQWVLWLPTDVTLATLLMERAPGLVRVMGLGVGQLQLVKVRILPTHICNYIIYVTALSSVSCGSPLSIDNGSPGTPTRFTADSEQDCPQAADHTGVVVGGAVAGGVVTVIAIVMGVVIITYLVLRYKRGGAM